MIKAIIFDMDGVIVDSEALHFKAEKIVLERHGLYRTKEEEDAFIGRPFETAVKELLKKQNKKIGKNIEIDFKKLSGEKYKEFNKLYPELKSIRNTEIFIKEKKDKYTYALVTSSTKDIAEDLMTKFGLIGLFKAFITANDIEKPKPDPDPYLKALKELNLDAKDCVVVEDSIAGIMSAKSAGINCIGLAGTFPAEKLKQADFVVDKIDDYAIKELEKMENS
jgi:HAD superfamily hydrolase (TIGR01509 family)